MTSDICVSLQTLVALSPLQSALTEIEELHPGMTVMQLRVFIAIANQGVVYSSELSTLLSISSPSISRCVEMLSNGHSNRRKFEGLDLVQSVLDMKDKRRKPLMLTKKGALLAKLLSTQLNELRAQASISGSYIQPSLF